jgi:hypothetical protein
MTAQHPNVYRDRFIQGDPIEPRGMHERKHRLTAAEKEAKRKAQNAAKRKAPTK